MASDNKDCDTAMPDTALHAIGNVIHKIGTMFLQSGQTLEGELTAYLATRASSSWDAEDLTLFIDFAKQVSKDVFDLVFLMANWLTDFGRFIVPTKLFRLILKNSSPKHQWIRVVAGTHICGGLAYRVRPVQGQVLS